MVVGPAAFPPASFAVQAESSARITFTITGDPLILRPVNRDPLYRFPARVEIQQSQLPGDWRSGLFRPRILVVTENPEAVERFQVGTRWESSGRLQSREGPHTGLYRSSWRFHPDSERVMKRPVSYGTAIIQKLFQGRRLFSDRMEKLSQGSHAERSVLQALLLGNRSGLEPEVMDRFARTGLVHVFAVSGLHIGMLAGMLWFMLRRVHVPYRYRAWVVLPVCFLFVFFSGMRASSLRALIMLGCLWAAPFWYRRMNVTQAFALAVCVILALSPGQIADVGFQFSFLLVAALLGLAPLLSDVLTRWTEPDPWAPPGAGLLRRLQALWRSVSRSLVASMICVAMAAPLTAYYFNMFSPIGALGNLLAVPLVFLILLSGFPVLMLQWIPLPGAALFWSVPEGFTSLLLSWTAWLESFDLGWSWVRAPALWMVVAVYGCLIPAALSKSWRRASLCAGLGLLMFFCVQEGVRWSRTRLTVLPTERGQAFLLQKGFQPAVLIDAGSDWDAWEVGRVLKEEGINRIAAVLFTHDDPHHTTAWPALQQDWSPQQMFAPLWDVHSIEERTGISGVKALSEGDVRTLGGWTLEVLHPEAEGEMSRADDRSLVLRFTDGFRSVLVMGGAGERVETLLLWRNLAKPARVLCAGNPRRGAFLHPSFLETVDPETVLFSGQGFDGIRMNRREAEQRVGETGRNLIRSDGGPAHNIVF
jgi:competence protein ComEC